MLFLCVVIIFVTSYLVLSFQAYTTVVVQLMALLWFHALCRWLLRRFGTTYFLHLQGDWHHLESFTLNMETTPPKRRNSRLQAGAETQKRTINVEISLNNNHKHNYVFMTVVHTYFYIVVDTQRGCKKIKKRGPSVYLLYFEIYVESVVISYSRKL
jgi:hypothetical protein